MCPSCRRIYARQHQASSLIPDMSTSHLVSWMMAIASKPRITLSTRMYLGTLYILRIPSQSGLYMSYTHHPLDSFFWFIESRKDPANAPLAIWLNGGPGASSLMGLLEENGPCFITSDSKSTYLNEWSWNNEVNSKLKKEFD